jgi:hypothetical protein
MSRRRPEFQTLDLASWPTLAWTELDAAQRSRVQRHIDAIERYASGEPVGSIETTTRINRRQLYRFLDTALSLHADGRIYGFRALVVHARETEYTRLLPVTKCGERAVPWVRFRYCLSVIPGSLRGSCCRSDSAA